MNIRAVIAAGGVVLVAGFSVACGTRPSAVTGTPSPTHASTQPAGMPLLYGWDGVSGRMITSGVFRTTQTTPFYDLDWRTWAFSGTRWAALTGDQALPSIKGAESLLVYDTSRQRDVLIVSAAAGGALLDSATAAGVWEWDGHSWQHRTTAHSTPKYLSQYASAAYSSDLHAVVLIDGGIMPNTGQDNTWIYDGTDWRSLTTSHWPAYSGYLQYDPARHAIIALDKDYATWQFDGADWSQIPVQGNVTPRITSAMGRQAPSVAFDQIRERWVVFGGFDGANWFADTWTGDGSTWTREGPASSPLARATWPGRTLIAWDPARKVVVLFGGEVRSGQILDLGDTWSWDGHGWTQLAGPSYPPLPPPTPLPTLPPASAPRVTSPPPLVPPSSNLLFAVVESPAQSQPDTVAIVGMDGYAKAKAKFQPRIPAYIPDAAVPQQRVAQIVGNSVYYIDGTGVVRKLQVGASPQTVATFSQPADQYETWFAVSPDGSQLMAGVLTFPSLGPVVSPAPWPTLVGPWKFDLQSAPAGGKSTVLMHEESTIGPDYPGATWKPLLPVGWTSGGPVGMVPVSIGTQNAWFGGPLFQLDSAGKQTQQLGGFDCDSAHITASGLIACMSGMGTLSVRDSKGSTLWTSQIMAFNALQLSLAPDGQSVSDGSIVEIRTGWQTQIPGFTVQGWLDNNTVVGRMTTQSGFGDLAWVSLGDPGTIHDFGFKGDFVGTLPHG